MNQVLYEIKDRIAYITMNRPEKRNALSPELISDLSSAMEKAESDSNAKVVVLKGAGKAFCAGADLSYIQHMQNFTFEENLEDSSKLKELFKKIYTSPKVVIANVSGHAIAGGCGLASVCDYSFSIPEAKFGYTEVRIGFIPALVMVFLIRKIGEHRARDLMLSGRLIEANEALEKGLINKVIPRDEIDQYVDSFAQDIAINNSAESIAQTKAMMAALPKVDLDASLNFAAEMNAKSRESGDCKKGINAFLNKEKPEW